MTDREILAAIRRHCAEAVAERASLPPLLSAYQARRLLGFCERTIREIQAELSHVHCGCNRGPVDGSGILCGDCWKETACDE